MNKDNLKQRYLNIAIFICIYLVISGIPFHYFIDNELLISIFNIILKISFLVFAVYYIRKYQFEKPKLDKLRVKYLLFIPFLLIAISNLIACFIFKYQLNDSPIQAYQMIIDIITCLLVSICEELCFRVVLHDEIRKNNGMLKSIIISSAIFGLAHLLNISSIGLIVPSLIQVVYSFGLGLILALVYSTSNNYILPVIIHLLFNYFNSYFVFYFYNLEWDVSFYLTNVVIALIILLYGVLIYIIFKKEKDANGKS